MSKIITPGSSEHLIDPAFDQFLDGKPTRRELQETFRKIGISMTQLYEALDTQALVGNFLCEKLGVTRGEIDAYVAKKAAEINEAIKVAQAQQGQLAKEGIADAQSNS